MALKRELLSTNEVADLLGVTPFTIRRYIQLRKLKAVKLMGSYRVRQTDLEQFLKAREIEPEDELVEQQTLKPPVPAAPPRASRDEKRRVTPQPKHKPRASRRQ